MSLNLIYLYLAYYTLRLFIITILYLLRMQSYFPPTKYYKSSLLKRLSSIKTKGNASPFKFKRNSSFLVPLLTIKTARMNNPKLKIPLNSARRNSTYFQQTIDPLKTKIPLFQLQVSPIEPKPLNKPPLTNKALRRLLRL